ncbi:hypothetical protein EGT67_04865 [Prescottella agglutinans]|uniref:Uncharacterized protein n=1 Tax=Prescottella agglutinans TaxID=1644129 RepID=A0A3S3AHZ2_9NOCA|nr:hypothetical protein [Prescottella agglutinans]RVW10502.1 hypothetical protein EGT67_04865 [Prescottella agglutinans]
MSTAHSARPTAAPRTSYEEEFVHMMDDIDTLIESTTNPIHRKILVNYRRHGLLEVSGRYDELLAPAMTVDEPHYRVFEGGQGVILDGMSEVRGFYQTLAGMDMLVMWTGKQKMAVADWGFAGEAEFSQFVPGKMLGDNVFGSLDENADSSTSEYDADAYYLVRRTLAFVWHYDNDVRLIGEHVYEDVTSKTVTKVAPEDVITGSRAAELLESVIDKYELPQ